MKTGDKFYKIEALISYQDVETKMEELKSNSKSSMIFNIFEYNGLKVYEVSIRGASARVASPQMELDISANGESSIRKGFKRFTIED